MSSKGPLWKCKQSMPILLASSLFATLACEDKSSTSDATATGQLVIAPDFIDMGLSTALSTDVPASMKGQGEEATATAGTIIINPGLKQGRQRSIEGCEIRRSVKNGLNLIREMAQEICYVEAGAKSFKPNGKYNVSYEEDGYTGTYSLWIDDTTPNKRRVSLCSDGRLRYIFDLEAARAGQAKGNVTRLNDDPEMGAGETWAVQASFDSGVGKAGRTQLDILGNYGTSYGKSRERLFISYEPKNIGFVAEAKVGESVLDDGSIENWTTQSAALLALNLGSVVNRYAFSVQGSEEPATTGANRAYFDGKGYALAVDDSEAWKAGGPLFVEPSYLPRLPEWTSLPVPSDAWDCSGTTEVTPEGTAEDFAKCDALQVDWDEENCEDESLYTYSGDEETISDSQISTTDKIEWNK